MKIYKSELYMKKGDTLSLFFSKNRGSEPLHKHEFIEIVYVLQGSSAEYINDVRYDVKHGDMVFINYHSTHRFECSEDYKYVNICFSPEVLGETMINPENAFSLLSLTAFNEMSGGASGGKVSFRGEERKEIEDILRAMQREKKAGLPSKNRVMESYMNIIITKMLRKTTLGQGGEELDGIWQELVEYIDNNLDSKLTLSSLASKCFYNPSYFSRIFKEKFDMSLTEYINRKRVEMAIELLRSSKLSVDEISSRVGFYDRSTFYHVFSKITGKTPSEYREGEK